MTYHIKQGFSSHRLAAFLAVGAILAITIFGAKEGQACAFNCSKTPELRASGFVTKTDDATPFANGYRGKTPAPMIKNATEAKLVIWLHGQHNPRKKEVCSKQGNLPPKSVLQLGDLKDVFIYYHCTAITDPKVKKDNLPDDGIHYKGGYAHGSYILARRDELADVIDSFTALGVSPANITIAGHSAGGWTALLAAASYPDKIGGVIAFAPAFAGVRAEEDLYPWWRKIIRPEQIEMISQPNDVPKLIFAYEDDAFNRPQELRFLTDQFPDSARLISQKCGGGHLSHKNDCQRDQTVRLMTDFIGK